MSGTRWIKSVFNNSTNKKFQYSQHSGIEPENFTKYIIETEVGGKDGQTEFDPRPSLSF